MIMLTNIITVFDYLTVKTSTVKTRKFELGYPSGLNTEPKLRLRFSGIDYGYTRSHSPRNTIAREMAKLGFIEVSISAAWIRFPALLY